MKRIKTTALAIFATAILTTGLFSCSNDDATTATNNKTEQQTI